MTRMKPVMAILLTMSLACSSAFGQEAPPAFERADEGDATAAEYDPFDPATDAPKLIRVQVEHVEMAHKDLTRLLMEDKADTADASALRMKVRELVEKDVAKVLDTQVVVGRSGQKSQTVSREELIYPTEFTLESMDEKITERMKQAISSPFPSNPATPTAFETRNLGSSLESEPTLDSDGHIIDLRFLSELTWHTGDTIWSESKDALGNSHKIAMPDFYTMETNTSVTCIAGQYHLVGVLSPRNAEGKLDSDRKVMVFVKCDVLPVIP
jgi:hypothetical protein